MPHIHAHKGLGKLCFSTGCTVPAAKLDGLQLSQHVAYGTVAQHVAQHAAQRGSRKNTGPEACATTRNCKWLAVSKSSTGCCTWDACSTWGCVMRVRCAGAHMHMLSMLAFPPLSWVCACARIYISCSWSPAVKTHFHYLLLYLLSLGCLSFAA